MTRLFLVFLAVLALAVPSQAAVRGRPSLGDLRLSPPVDSLATPRFATPMVDGGGDGLITGPTKTLGWVLLGSGAAVAGVGVLTLRGGEANYGIGGTLVGSGAVAALAGGILLWTAGTVNCATCGLVDRTKDVVLPTREALVQTIDPKRRSDRGKRIPIFAWKF